MFPSATLEALPDFKFAGDLPFGVGVPVVVVSADSRRRFFLRGLRELCHRVFRRSPAAVPAACNVWR